CVIRPPTATGCRGKPHLHPGDTTMQATERNGNGRASHAPPAVEEELAAVRALLAEVLARLGSPAFVIHGAKIVIKPATPAVHAGQRAAAWRCPESPPPPGPRNHRRILEVATPFAVPTKKLARLAGFTYNSHFRRAVASLVRQGFLEYTPDGVRL